MLILFLFFNTIFCEYSNPIINQELPDPTVIRAKNGLFYVYATEGIPYTPIFRSPNLVDWEFVGTAFTAGTRPTFDPNGGIWAPDINYINEKYVLYYAMCWGTGDDTSGVGVAISDSPEGPFKDLGPLLQSGTIGVPNSIDPCYYKDGENSYIIWGSFAGIYSLELESDGLSLKKGTQKRQVVGGAFEGVNVNKRGKYYYLFASIGGCCSGIQSTYQLVVGRSEAVLGPYYNKEGGDMMNNQYTLVISSNDRFVGNGHCSEIVQDDAGNDWLLYHGYDVQHPDGKRMLMMDRILWDDDDWPYIKGGTPSLVAESPVINK